MDLIEKIDLLMVNLKDLKKPGYYGTEVIALGNFSEFLENEALDHLRKNERDIDHFKILVSSSFYMHGINLMKHIISAWNIANILYKQDSKDNHVSQMDSTKAGELLGTDFCMNPKDKAFMLDYASRVMYCASLNPDGHRISGEDSWQAGRALYCIGVEDKRHSYKQIGFYAHDPNEINPGKQTIDMFKMYTSFIFSLNHRLKTTKSKMLTEIVDEVQFDSAPENYMTFSLEQLPEIRQI